MEMAYTNQSAYTNSDHGYHNIPGDLDRIDNLDGWEIADYEPDPRGHKLMGRDGKEIGKIDSLLASPSSGKAYFAIVECGGWFNNKKFVVPLEQIQFNPDENKAYAPYVQDQFRNAPEWREDNRDFNRYYTYWSGHHQGADYDRYRKDWDNYSANYGERDFAAPERREMRATETEEVADVQKVRREAGYVSLRKVVDVEHRHISEPVTHTRVTVERRPVEDGEAYAYDDTTSNLREGETLRVPVVEEELVVEKTPRVTGEVVVRTDQETRMEERDVELRREHVEVDEEGDVDVDNRTAAGTRDRF
jgi:uncharacterized protein (TIGR02271 family)